MGENRKLSQIERPRPMIFNIHHDSGDRISGTVIPDSYSQICQIRVSAGGQQIAVFPTNEVNQGVLDIGMHETGLVNFTITEQTIPGLSSFKDLELNEASSNLLLYRRLRPGMVPQRFLRLEMQLLPLWRFDDAVRDLFQQYYNRIETLGFNGTRQLFHLSQTSIYVSGRILIKNFMHSIDNGFKLLCVLRDPYEELAERLLVMNKLNEEQRKVLGAREAMKFEKTIEYAASLPIQDEKALVHALRRIPKEVATALANPLVRQLSTSDLDEQPQQSGVTTALDMLAQSAIVGLHSEPKDFVAAFSEMIDRELSEASLFPRFAKVIALAEIIKSSGACDGFLEYDLELYHHVRESHRRSAARSSANLRK